MTGAPSGGELVGELLALHGVPCVFTLCGGHISPILVAAKRRGIRVVDVRDEATAVFAADAVARLTGVPGVAVVTAGPGVTNTVTAVKNAQLAQSAVVLLGGAAATLLRGRGALQDIDQMALLRPHVKWAASVRRVRHLAPALATAFREARTGVPGPVFVECPVDVLYPEAVVREWYAAGDEPRSATGLAAKLRRRYVGRHLDRLFAPAEPSVRPAAAPPPPACPPRAVARAAAYLRRAERPVLLLGSQVVLRPDEAGSVADAVARLGVPAYGSGMARGLLSRDRPPRLAHSRAAALREADVVILAGVACDFRLQYGTQINRGAAVIAVNRNRADLALNRRPALGVPGDPATFLGRLAALTDGMGARWSAWDTVLRERDAAREREIDALAGERGEHVNTLHLCRVIDRLLDDDGVVVVDGGDFAATASYVVSPRRPLSFLDPGAFGTLGAGAGLALGARLCRQAAEVWILYGDGAAAFSLAEFDTFVRHGLGVIAVVGNDGAWTQIARAQRALLGDDVATVLRRTDYERVAEGYGGQGFRIEEPEAVEPVLRAAKAAARGGAPVLVNVLLGPSAFREGSIAM